MICRTIYFLDDRHSGQDYEDPFFMQEIPELAGVPAFWVNSAACVDVARNKVTHKLAHGELIETEPWLKDGPITIGKAPAWM